MGDLVTIETKGGVADVRLNRPDKYNALSRDLFAALGEAGERLADDASVRAVVLSGNGRGFCAGLDMDSFRAMTSGESGTGGPVPSKGERPDNFFQRSAYVWKQLPVPVIAAVHGVAYGGGLQIALAPTSASRAPSPVLDPEISGADPRCRADQTVRDIVRLDVAKELTWTGRIFDGNEALALGLVTRLAEDPLAAALETAREIASKSPDAIRHGKRLLEEAWHADPATGLGLEARLQGKLIGSRNQVEAVKAALEKRDARFENPKD